MSLNVGLEIIYYDVAHLFDFYPLSDDLRRWDDANFTFLPPLIKDKTS